MFPSFPMLLPCSFFRLRELFQVKNDSTTSLLFFFKKRQKIWVGRTTLNGEKIEDGLIYIYFFKSIAWNPLSRIPFPFAVFPFLFPFPWFRFRIPDSGFHVLVLPMKYSVHLALDVQRRLESAKVKKSIGLNACNNNFSRVSNVLVYFFADACMKFSDRTGRLLVLVRNLFSG